ncbi:uncharacterized protein C8orf58 homolog isoform X1 [Sarcophilus harrisii]|uniref:uncharacterized protein C8orf58 homolog isoform X1 n=1 Tax=Sarcophilus harrisii TaxID=9305 RepID=UPI0002272228|nr:uncharacterized protein C8orf58 homolog isoform X1 [Sarcophilus harrisii]
MLGRRRVFTLQPLGRQDGGCQELLGGCVVLGVKSIYLRVHDMPRVPSADPQEGDHSRRDSREQASRDSGVEMAGEESSPISSPDFALDSSSLELGGGPTLAPVTTESLPDLDRFLASQKLEQVVARSCRSRSSSTLAPKRWQRSKQRPGVSPEVTGVQGGTEAAVSSQCGPEESQAVGSESDAWACLPGQGLRYLEHLCLMLERMATLQQLHLQLQEQCQQLPSGMEETNESSVLAPFHPRSFSVLGSQEFQSLMEKTVEESALPRWSEVHSVSAPNLLEGPEGTAHTVPSYQGHRNTLSHWDKVKALLNRMRWRSPRASESSLAQDPSVPRRDSKELPEGPLHYLPRKTFLPSLVSKKHRAKNFSVC